MFRMLGSFGNADRLASYARGRLDERERFEEILHSHEGKRHADIATALAVETSLPARAARRILGALRNDEAAADGK